MRVRVFQHGTHSGYYCGSDGDTLLSDSCTGSGIVANTVTVCSQGRDGCVSSLSQYWDYYCSGSSCDYTASCENQCCHPGQECNEQGQCVPIVPPCVDNDGDDYGVGDTTSCLNSGTDCDDSNSAVHQNNACGVCAAEPAVRPNTQCEAG